MWKALDDFVTDASSRPVDFMRLSWAEDWCRRLGFAFDVQDTHLHISHARNAEEKRELRLEYTESGDAFIPIARQFEVPAVASAEFMLGVAVALSFHNGAITIHGYQGNWRTVYGAVYAEQTARFAKSILDPLIRTATCFISYSSGDAAFAAALKSALHREGYRTWYAPEQMEGGSRISDQVEQAIRTHDRFVLVLSENSIRSEWVRLELAAALKFRTQMGSPTHFPIRLCDMGTLARWRCVVDGEDLGREVLGHFIPDFSAWKAGAADPLFQELARCLAAVDIDGRGGRASPGPSA